MNIGSVAEATGLPAKTIRYYESIGLVGPAERSTGNYRLYGEREVMTLRFIERARQQLLHLLQGEAKPARPLDEA